MSDTPEELEKFNTELKCIERALISSVSTFTVVGDKLTCGPEGSVLGHCMRTLSEPLEGSRRITATRYL